MPRTTPRPGEVALPVLCQKYVMECNWDGVAQTVSLSYKGARIKALIGSKTVMIGEERISLEAPLALRKGVVFVPADFEQSVITPAASPLAGAPPSLPRRTGKVVIDPGHGGKDPGAIGYNGVREKDVNLGIALGIRDELVKAGVEVIMTREKDEFISLERRTEIATRSEVEVFVSVHANSNRSSSAHGVEVYYLGALNSGDRTDGQRRENERALSGQLRMASSVEDVRKIVLSMLYDHKIGTSSGFADRAAHMLSNRVGEKSRGAKPQRYFVLRNTLVPAILIEVGFVSNPREGRKLADPSYRQEIADVISQSILEYLYAAGI